MINTQIKSLVFIDDDEINNFLIQTSLQNHGYHGEVRFFDFAADALDYLRQIVEESRLPKPDFIFLDIKMPKMNGFEFLQAFKEKKLNTSLPSKIFMVSSSTNQKDRDESIRSGIVEAYIEKPLSVDTIEKIAEKHLKC